MARHDTELLSRHGRVDKPPICYIIAGPNGAGKTTFALEFLPRYVGCFEFVNPDLIAAGLAPLNPTASAVQAGRLVLRRIADLSRKRADFGFETTLSGRTYLRIVQNLKRRGYRICLFFVWIRNPRLAGYRIANRVRMGGHDIPETDQLRRFPRTMRNLALYRELTDAMLIFDNSFDTPVLVYKRTEAGEVVLDQDAFGQIAKEVAP